MNRENRVLAIVAVKPEWSFLKSHFDLHKSDTVWHSKKFPLTLLQTGMGDPNVTSALTKISPRDFDTVINWGTCGALNSDFKIGDWVVPLSVEKNSESLILQNEFLIKLKPSVPYKTAKLLCVDTPLSTPAQKQKAAEDFQTQVVDMESFAVAKWCQSHKKKIFMFKCVFDACHEDLSFLGDPPCDDQGNVSVLKIASNVLQNPSLIFRGKELSARLKALRRDIPKILVSLFE